MNEGPREKAASLEPSLHTEESRHHFQYAYGIKDRLNPVQETSGATILANILPGLGIDEFLMRTDVVAGLTSNFLTNALGSPIAVTDNAGVVQTEYAYEPFGKTTVSGSSNSSSYQYTGRENDGTGIYYYRARYYHPGLQRFISEDPLRLKNAFRVEEIVPTGIVREWDWRLSRPAAKAHQGNLSGWGRKTQLEL